MPRRLAPPPGAVTRSTTVRVLMREGIINSSSMLEKLNGIEHIVPKGRKHGFYGESSVLQTINDHRVMYGKQPLKSIFEDDHVVTYRQATPDDMSGVYEVARKLFGHTTPASTRVALLKRCPEGNGVVTDNGMVVSYVHLYPLKAETLEDFLSGKIRGESITADSLDPFTPGKVVDVLVKSLGSYHESPSVRKRYSKALFVGMKNELVRWGHKGYIIHRIYATSETQDGITAAIDFRMLSLGKIKGSKGKRRFAFVLDPSTSQNHMAHEYLDALEEWKELHPKEYKNAWDDWNKNHPSK